MKPTRALPIITMGMILAAWAPAQVPSMIAYQGRLSADGTNVFDGTGQFKFALVNAGTNVHWQAKATATVSGEFLTVVTVTDGGFGYLEIPAVTITDATGSNAMAKATILNGVVTAIDITNPGRHYSSSPVVTIAAPPPSYAFVTYWGNDGTSEAGGEPVLALPLAVNQGLFAVNLGDTSVSNMTASIPPSVFTNIDVRLRIWFSDGTSVFQQFYPDQRLTSVPYAMLAANVADGSVTSPKLAPGAVGSNAVAPNAVGNANVVDGAITLPKLSPEAAMFLRLPVGSVMAWLKNMPNTPPLSSDWVECNGQVLNDVQSPYHGQAIPDLNGATGSAQRFLRGSTVSGAKGGEDKHALTSDELPQHSHDLYGSLYRVDSGPSNGQEAFLPSRNPIASFITTTAVGTGVPHETRPSFYEVVWILRVK